MYQTLVKINTETHAKLGHRPSPDYLFAAREMVVELVHNEINDALAALPLAFIAPQDDGPQLVALLSLLPGQNAFVTPDGTWVAGYLPSILRAYPFALVSPADAPDQPLVCIEERYLADAADDSPALFTEDGKHGERLSGVLEFFRHYLPARKTTRRAAQALMAAGVLVPWDLSVTIDGKETRLTGLYEVDEGNLKALAPELLAELRDSGALLLAYAQMLSRGRIKLLEKATGAHLNHRHKRQVLAEELNAALGDGDTLSFGF